MRPAEWYAIYTKHHHEKRIAQLLASKGVRVFLPLYAELHQWSDRRRWVKLPLFPGYVFVETNLEDRRRILATPGVFRFVSFGPHPEPVPRQEIEDLQRVCENRQLEPCPFFQVGDRVRVRSGPFAGVEGILVRQKGQTRLVLRVDLLQKAAWFEIDAAQTERVGAPSCIPPPSPAPRVCWTAQ
jgi:transcription elongation factor/antiterminator RfaH